MIVCSNGEIIWANDLAQQWLTLAHSLPETLKHSCIIDGHWLEPLNKALDKAQPYTVSDLKLTCHEQQRSVLLVLEPLKSPEHRQDRHFACQFVDLEKTRQLEKALADSKIQLNQISEQAGKVAHELNGPLDGTLRYLNLAQQILDQGRAEKAQKYLGHCVQGLHHIAVITQEMLNLVQAYTPKMDRPIPVDTILQEAVQAIRMQVPLNSIKVRQQVQPDLPCVYRTRLFQVFCNLIKNAFDAMPNGGTLTIEAKESHDYENLYVSFTDDGPGIATKNIPRVFDPFFTTRPRGTGLGLTICRDLLMKIRGTVQFKASTDQGTCFYITVPLKNIT